MGNVQQLRQELAVLQQTPPRPRDDRRERAVDMVEDILSRSEDLAAAIRPEIRVDVQAPNVTVDVSELRAVLEAQQKANEARMERLERAWEEQVALLREALENLTVKVEAPVTVNVPENPVTIEQPARSRRIEFQRNQTGQITAGTVVEE